MAFTDLKFSDVTRIVGVLSDIAEDEGVDGVRVRDLFGDDDEAETKSDSSYTTFSNPPPPAAHIQAKVAEGLTGIKAKVMKRLADKFGQGYVDDLKGRLDKKRKS